MRLDIGNGYHLSSVKISDKEEYLKHFDDKGEISDCKPNIPYPYTESIADWWIEHRFKFKERAGKEILFAIRNPEGLLIGSVGVDDFRVGEFHRAEVEFWLTKAYRGRGITTEALRGFVHYAFSHLGIVRLTAYVLDFDVASVRVLEKNGFRLEGCLRKHTKTRNGLFDTFVYGLLKDDLNIYGLVELNTSIIP